MLGFLAITAVGSRPADPSLRLSRNYRLADLIERQQSSTTALRRQVAGLRRDVERIRSRRAGDEAESAAQSRQLKELGLAVGLVPMAGPGVKVTLDDSDLDRAPTGNVNDLVVHSQDVQAVVNALWKAGAEAVAINGQRLIATSAVLCVGNTLLINGTVHSPPFRFTALGANLHDAFMSDPLVERFAEDADRFKLGFKVEDRDRLSVPAYTGTSKVRFARAG